MTDSPKSTAPSSQTRAHNSLGAGARAGEGASAGQARHEDQPMDEARITAQSARLPVIF